MSKANKLSFKETLSTSDKKIIYLLATLLTSIVLVGGMVFVTNQYFLASTISSNTKPNGNQTSNESSIEATGNVVVEDEKTLTDTYTSTTSDESVIINLENTNLIFGSNILLNIGKTSEWGNNDSNGGVVTLNAKNQKLAGNILVESISALSLNLENSTYEGAINSDNSAKSIAITLDKNSTITLTGDSYITLLNDSDPTYSNINFNGYKLNVNGTAIN